MFAKLSNSLHIQNTLRTPPPLATKSTGRKEGRKEGSLSKKVQLGFGGL